MAGNEEKALEIEEYDYTDFGFWIMQIENYISRKKLHLQLQVGALPNDMEDTN